MQKEFDHTVEKRDPKTGRVISRNDYIMRVGHNGTEYERPPGSGMIYDPTGTLIRDEYKERRELEAKAASEKAEAEKAAKLAADNAEKQKIIDAAKAEADELRRQIVAEAQAEADAIKAEANKALEEATAPKGK
jgi:hypothetical protein